MGIDGDSGLTNKKGVGVMDSTVENKIRDVVSQFVKDGYMFTSWDITAFLRKNGERIKHSDTRQVVADMYANSEMSNYIRDVVDVNAGVNPFCYLSPASDISNYSADWVTTNPSQTGMKDDGFKGFSTLVVNPNPIPVPANVAVNASTSSIPSCLDPDVKTVTAEGRLNISPSIVSSVGLDAGDTYSVTGTNDSIKITGDMINGKSVVNSDGRIRISASILETFCGQGDEYHVTVNNGVIEVSPV